MQDAFLLQNKLVRPDIIRESTNRPNIQYYVQVDDGQAREGSVAERAAKLISASCARKDTCSIVVARTG